MSIILGHEYATLAPDAAYSASYGSDYRSSEWGDLLAQVIEDVKESIIQINAGMGIPHDKVMETYKKWL